MNSVQSIIYKYEATAIILLRGSIFIPKLTITSRHYPHPIVSDIRVCEHEAGFNSFSIVPSVSPGKCVMVMRMSVVSPSSVLCVVPSIFSG